MDGWMDVHVWMCICIPSVQFSSVSQSCLTVCNPMSCSTPGLPVQHQLLEPTQTYVHWVGGAIQPSHPLSSPSPPALSIRVFSNESALCTRWPKYWSFSFNIPSETLNKELIFHWGKKKTFIKNNRNPKPGCKVNHQVKQYSEFWKLGWQCAVVRRIK